jgi:CRP-like cAMP-binding protein
MSSSQARSKSLYRLEPGDLVGELSFMDDEPRFAALIASGRTEVLVLARGDFETLIEPSPQVVYKVMRAIMRVARRVQRRLSVQVREMENYIYRTGAKFVA